MNELKKIITMLIDDLCNCWFEEADDEDIYPYAVFKLTSEADFDKDDYILEIDVYHPDIYELDELCDNIIKRLDRYKEYGQIQTCIYRINKLMLPNTQDTKRRQLRFVCKTYKGDLV